MKLYTFVDDNGKTIVSVRAENHDEAVKYAITDSQPVNGSTEYEFETIED